MTLPMMRRCGFWVDPEPTEDGKYVIYRVDEDEAGELPVVWRLTYVDARECADFWNLERGLTAQDVIDIRVSAGVARLNQVLL